MQKLSNFYSKNAPPRRAAPNNALQLTASCVRSCLATPRMINGRRPSVYGPIKTFLLRGIKDSPPDLHGGRLLTLEDTVEFFNLMLDLKLIEPEKKDLVAFMRQL
jgi:hypothetical protein